MKNLYISVGKRYVRRNGTVTPPLIAEGDWATDPEESLAYGTTGGPKDHQVFSFMETDKDIIAEFVNV